MTIPALSGCTNEGFDRFDSNSSENLLIGNTEEPLDLQYSEDPAVHYSEGFILYYNND